MTRIIRHIIEFYSKKSTSFKVQFTFAMLILTLIPTILASYVSYDKATDSITNNTLTNLQNNLIIFDDILTDQFTAIDFAATQFSLDEQVLDLLSLSSYSKINTSVLTKYGIELNRFNINKGKYLDNKLRTYASSLDKNIQSSMNLYLYGGGIGVYHFSPNVFDLDEIRSTDWYLNMPITGAYHIFFEPYNINQPNLPGRILYARRLYALKGYNLNFSAVVTIELPLQDVQTSLMNIKPFDNSTICLIDENNQIISSTSNNEAVNGLYSDQVLSSKFEALTTTSFDGYQMTHFIEDNHLVTAMPVLENRWLIITKTPLSEINKDINVFRNLMILVSLICISIGTIIALILANRMTEPIYLLVDSMKKLDSDNLYVEISDYRYKNEFGYLISHYNKTNKKIRTLIRQMGLVERAKRQAELDVLQAQINPHFLYNTLDAVNWMAIKHNNQDISTMVTSLSDFFRYSLNKGKHILSIQDEIRQVSAYLQIQKTRFPDLLDYSIDIEPSVLQHNIIKLSLQPLIENAIVHGIEPMGEKGNITVLGIKTETAIQFTVIDDGFGCSVSKLNAILDAPIGVGTSYGIKNVHNRIRLRYGLPYGLRYSNNDYGGITCTVTIPLEIKEKNQDAEDDHS